MAGQRFLKHTVRVREEAVDIAIMYCIIVSAEKSFYHHEWYALECQHSAQHNQSSADTDKH